jgi:hypothetical protein
MSTRQHNTTKPTRAKIQLCPAAITTQASISNSNSSAGATLVFPSTTKKLVFVKFQNSSLCLVQVIEIVQGQENEIEEVGTVCGLLKLQNAM